jgi:iron complex transport system permease protein
MNLAASRRALPLAITLFCLCVLVILIGISVGSSGFVNILDAWHDDVSWQIIWDIRIPRTIGAFAAGALLGLAGALAQAVFRTGLDIRGQDHAESIALLESFQTDLSHSNLDSL